MLDINAFAECIRTNLKDRRFGKERADDIIKQFRERAEYYRREGKTEADAGAMAMRDTFDRMSDATAEKAKRAAKSLAVAAEGAQRIKQGLEVDSKLFGKPGKDGKARGSRGKALGHAVKAMVGPDKRFVGPNYSDLQDLLQKQAYALMGDKLDKITVGAFGRQKGKAHLPNVVREVFGVDTGDATAKEIAKGWLDVSDFLVDSFNAAGGSMKKLQRYLPQAHNQAKLLRHSVGDFVRDHMDAIDWTRTRWPDGSVIDPEDRVDVLERIFDTQSSDGINKIDPKAFRGRGRAVGNALETHRFLHYKDADAWIRMHEKYGDGSVFDVLSRHIADMTHKTALVEVFGPNPEMAMRNIQSQAKVIAKANGVSMAEIKKMERVFKNVVDPMFEIATRSNPVDPESGLAAAAGTVSNLTTSALLGSVSLVSTMGDLATTAVIRKLNGLPMTGGMRFYFDSVISDRELSRQVATSSGWIFEQSINHMYSVERFNNVQNVGQAWSRRVADVNLRASGMVALTTAARYRAQAEFSAYMARTANKAFDEVPYKHVMARYGITPQEWDAFRKIKAFEPKPGVKLLRPMDILASDMEGDKTALFRKFQSMILSESRGMVPDSTVEASVALKGSTRPDSLHGAILHSFSMYKNFPLTFFQQYGQYAMTTKTAQGRLGFVAGLAAATTVSGAIGVQLNEMKNGRDPMDMTSGKFWLKSFMKGGGAGIWGDFLYSTTNDFGGGPAETVAGPLTGVVGDGIGLVLGEAGDLFAAESLEDYDSQLPKRLVDFAHRYTPGSNLWYAQGAFNKLFWEHLENAADPEASERRQRRMNNQERTYGNEYFWEPGEAFPQRAPDVNAAFGGEE